MSGLTMGSLDPASAAATKRRWRACGRGPAYGRVRRAGRTRALGALLEYLCARCEVVDLALAGRDVPAYLERMNFFRSFGKGYVPTPTWPRSRSAVGTTRGRCRS